MNYDHGGMSSRRTVRCRHISLCLREREAAKTAPTQNNPYAQSNNNPNLQFVPGAEYPQGPSWSGKVCRLLLSECEVRACFLPAAPLSYENSEKDRSAARNFWGLRRA